MPDEWRFGKDVEGGMLAKMARMAPKTPKRRLIEQPQWDRVARSMVATFIHEHGHVKLVGGFPSLRAAEQFVKFLRGRKLRHRLHITDASWLVEFDLP